MIEDAVAQLRSRLSGSVAAPTAQESIETRLALACVRGKGHVLFTGSDRGEIDATLARVIEKVAPMAAVRARATDPAGGLDPVLSLVASDSIPKAHLERRRALADLLARAEAAEKPVLVIVEDAEAATIEQLERLRETLEVMPEALKYLRMVLIGDSGLASKLNTQAGRPLSARIASHVSFDPTSPTKDDMGRPTVERPTASPRSQALTLATATCVAFTGSVYLSAFLTEFRAERRTSERQRIVRDVDVQSKDFAVAAGALSSDPSLGDGKVTAAAPFTPAFHIPAPRPAAGAAAPAASSGATMKAVAPAPAAKSSATTKTAAVAKPAAPAAKRAAAQKAKSSPAKSSISSFMQRFD
jgi:hypothetical protein